MSKVDLRIPQIARMRVAGHRDAIIAQTVGLTPAGLARILALPEYKDVEQAVLQGTISKMDMALAGRADLLRQEFKVGVPLAMRTLLEAVQQRRDLRAALEASKELLDRDPDRVFAKASRQPEAPTVPTLSGEVLQALAPSADAVQTKLAGVVSTTAPAAGDGTDVKQVNVPAASVSTKVQ
jgi:hypothetical protein